MQGRISLMNRNISRLLNQTRNMTYNTSDLEGTMITYQPYTLPHSFIVTLLCLYGFMIFVSIGGNFVVCYTIFTVQRLRTVTNFFLASLSFSDILMTVVCIPFTVMSNIIFHYWPFGNVMCPLVQYLQLVAVVQRSLTMVAVACDRHIVISKPLKKRISKPRARVMIFVFWMSSMIIALPTAIHSKIVYLQFEPGSNGLCMEMWESHKSRYIYSLFIMLLQYFVPLFILMCTYTHIGYMIWIKQPPGEADSTRDMRIASSKRKTLKMLFAVVITYALTWLPLHVLTISGDVNPELYNHMYAHILWLIFHFVAFSNCGSNPVIYFYMNKTFRSGFNVLFDKMFCVNRYSQSVRRFTMSVPSTGAQRSFNGSFSFHRRSRKLQKPTGSCQGSTELKTL